MTERWPGAKKYRDAFEAVKQNVTDPLADGKNYEPRQAIACLKSIIPSTLRSVEMGEDQQEFSRIVTDMSGQKLDSTTMQTFGETSMIGMEQVQYQSGSLLGLPTLPQGFEQSSSCDDKMNVSEADDDWDQRLFSGMDFSVGFETYDLENFSPHNENPLESTVAVEQERNFHYPQGSSYVEKLSPAARTSKESMTGFGVA